MHNKMQCVEDGEACLGFSVGAHRSTTVSINPTCPHTAWGRSRDQVARCEVLVVVLLLGITQVCTRMLRGGAGQMELL